MASTTEVVAALEEFLRRRGIEAEEATGPVAILEGQDPLGYWLTICENGLIVNVSKSMHKKTLERNPWTTDVRGMQLETLSFRGKEVYRTIMRQIAQFKKDGKPNRCLVTTVSGRYFGHLYPVEQVFSGQEHCQSEHFVWILNGFNIDYRQAAQEVKNPEASKRM